MSDDSMTVLGLFPTPIAKISLGRDISQDELDFLLSRQMRVNLGNYRSIDVDVLGHQEISGLRQFIQGAVDQYFKSIYAPSENVSLKITQSWLNSAEQGQYHHRHTHPNSFVSGVFYVKANREQDRIYFYQTTYRQLSVKTDQFNLYNSSSWWIEAGAGDLLLFPSSCTHDVPPVSSEKRISLSFNTFPIGCIGDKDGLMGLEVLDCTG